MAQDYIPVSVAFTDPNADDKQIPIVKAAADVYGGGLRLLSAEAYSTDSEGAGTTFTLQLMKYSNAGTPAVNGTVSAAVGASGWSAGVPQAFTLDTDYTFLDEGEYLMVDYQEDGGDPTGVVVVNAILVRGK